MSMQHNWTSWSARHNTFWKRSTFQCCVMFFGRLAILAWFILPSEGAENWLAKNDKDHTKECNRLIFFAAAFGMLQTLHVQHVCFPSPLSKGILCKHFKPGLFQIRKLSKHYPFVPSCLTVSYGAPYSAGLFARSGPRETSRMWRFSHNFMTTRPPRVIRSHFGEQDDRDY